MVQRKQNPSQPYYSATVLVAIFLALSVDAYVVPNRPIAFVGLTQQQTVANNNRGQPPANGYLKQSAADSLGAADAGSIPEPSLTTFREAEVLGLRLMQEGNYEEALKGMLLSFWSKVLCVVRFKTGMLYTEWQAIRSCDILMFAAWKII